MTDEVWEWEEEAEEKKKRHSEGENHAQLNHPHTSVIVCCHLAKPLTVDQWFPGHAERPVNRSVCRSVGNICRLEVILCQIQSPSDFLPDVRRIIIHNRK